MPLDFRYHLTSLAAVFFALLLGILVGVAMKEGPGMSSQIQQLRKEFNRSQALRNIDQMTNRFNEQTQPLLIRNRLFGRNVALVQDPLPFPGDAYETLRKSLQLAGATITVEITLKPTIYQLTPERLAALYLRAGVPVPAKPSIGDLLAMLAHDLGQQPSPALDALQAEKLLRLRGDAATPISTVILLAGTDPAPLEAVRKVDLPFLRGCLQRQLNTAGVEVFETPRSVISEYRKAVPLTVDNIDRAAGRIALILALGNGQRGHYGYKSTADDVAPDVE